MNRIVDEIETIAGDGNGQIYYDKFTTLMRKWVGCQFRGLWLQNVLGLQI